MSDPVELTRALIRCPSVTPKEGGAIELLEKMLSNAGFECARPDRNGISNLFARWGEKGHPRTFGFNGHTDVVPPGDPDAWTDPPFDAAVRSGKLWGRGAADMKSGVAAFVTAAIDLIEQDPPDGAIVIAITGDEEGDGIDGTAAILDWMHDNGEAMSACLVGEPTCPDAMGDMVKIGRRGSLTAYFTVTGIQGHSAYPHRAKNPVHAIADLAHRLASHDLDTGTDHFDPSTLQVTTIDVGNPANNVIPATASATVNIRFNDAHSSSTLIEWLGTQTSAVARAHDLTIDTTVRISGESFLTPPGPLTDLVAQAVEAETGVTPELSTSGGTSDARFIKDHCPVVEFGLVGATMHQVDEHVETADIETLKAVYSRIIRDYFA